MPTLPHNHILHGLSGKLGRVVLRQLNGKTIVQAAPVRKAPFRPGELANQQSFRQAVVYAKEARQNPELWKLYKAEAKRRGGTSNWYAVAISDCRKGFLLAGKLRSKKQKKTLKLCKDRPDGSGFRSIRARKNQTSYRSLYLFRAAGYQSRHLQHTIQALQQTVSG